MATYIGFLRAINLGATRKFPKDAIKAAVEAAGCTGVETYINTGNVRFTTSMRSRTKVEALLEDAFLADRGFAVPTIVFTPGELSDIARQAKSFGHTGKHYIELLRTAPSDEVIAALEAATEATHVARVGGRAIHLMVHSDYAGAALLRKSVEKQLGVTTNRNAKVIGELAARWGG